MPTQLFTYTEPTNREPISTTKSLTVTVLDDNHECELTTKDSKSGVVHSVRIAHDQAAVMAEAIIKHYREHVDHYKERGASPLPDEVAAALQKKQEPVYTPPHQNIAPVPANAPSAKPVDAIDERHEHDVQHRNNPRNKK